MKLGEDIPPGIRHCYCVHECLVPDRDQATAERRRRRRLGIRFLTRRRNVAATKFAGCRTAGLDYHAGRNLGN